MVALVDILTFAAQNPLTIFNTILLLFTGYLSYSSFKFQTRTSVRESLEQLDDVEFRQEKLRPILHELKFRPLRGHQTTVHLKYYTFGRAPESASRNAGRLFVQTHSQLDSMHEENDLSHQEFKNLLKSALESLDPVDRIEVDDTGIFLRFDTGNPVSVRRRTEQILQKLNEWHTTDQEAWIENVRVD